MKASQIFLLVGLFSGVLGGPDVKGAFEQAKLKPDIIDKAPEGFIKVTMGDGTEVNLGNTIMPRQTRETPKVQFDADPNKYYTFLMIDANSNDPNDTSKLSWLHWVVMNIPGTNFDQGVTKAEYLGSGPSKISGSHRYTFLLFKQKSKLTLDDTRLGRSPDGRPNFSVRKFIDQYDLGNPVSGNFYLAPWDDSVPEFLKSLGVE